MGGLPSRRSLVHYRPTIDTDHWSEESASFEAQRSRWQGMIEASEKDLADIVKRLDTLTNADLIRFQEASYQKVKHNISTYQAELTRIDALEADHAKRVEVRTRLFELTKDYRGLSLEDKRLVLQLCVERVEARRDDNDLTITVVYRGGKTQSRTIGLKPDGWTKAELSTLTTMMDENRTSLQIAGMLSGRTWQALVFQARRITGRTLSKRKVPLAVKETFLDYLNRAPVGYPEAYYETLAQGPEALLALLARSPEDVSAEYCDKVFTLEACSRPSGVSASQNVVEQVMSVLAGVTPAP